MPKEKILGFDIGNYRVKIAYMIGGVLRDFISVQHPDNMVKNSQIVSWQAMGDYLKEVLKASGIRGGRAAVTLPQDSCYIRRTTMPLMTEPQLKINLPYEFHDYITEEPEKYIYDYAVISKNEKEMDLMGVAVQRELVAKYQEMFHRAGLKLTVMAPDVMAFQNLFEDYERRHGIARGTKDYVVLDLGDGKIDIHFFTKGEYEITRSMEPGCHAIYEEAAKTLGEDSHVVQRDAEMKLSASDSLRAESEVNDICSNIAVQIMRVLNFYSFNNPHNTLDTLYCCGGGANIPILMKDIAENAGLPLKSMAEIVEVDHKFDGQVLQSPQALGITLQ